MNVSDYPLYLELGGELHQTFRIRCIKRVTHPQFIGLEVHFMDSTLLKLPFESEEATAAEYARLKKLLTRV